LNDPIIKLDNVHLTLTSRAGPVHILRGVSLAIPRGQSAAIVGPSGSGKTSLLMTMAGLERTTSGRITVSGRELGPLSEDELAVLRGAEMGIVFQSFHLVPTMTALENVALPMELAGEAGALEAARSLLTEVGLGSRVDHFPAELSGGEQQRVAVARALAPNPAIVAADEPTGNLDEDTGKQIIELLFASHAQRGTTLVLVTHDQTLAARCERVLRLRSGRIDGESAK
jgi:putative ABC transport system ATP-binding protein